MKIFIYAIIAIVMVSVIAGFFIVGSPQEERLRRFDEQRVSDLSQLQWQIVNYWQSKEKLPESLSDLKDEIRGFTPPPDPETRLEYEYTIKGPLTFELCTTFNRPTYEVQYRERPPAKPYLRPAEPYGGLEDTWEHGQGRFCFERTIDPEFYPPFNKSKG